MRRTLALVALAVALLAVPLGAAAGGQKVTLTLDWTPNPDHVGDELLSHAQHTIIDPIEAQQ